MPTVNNFKDDSAKYEYAIIDDDFDIVMSNIVAMEFLSYEQVEFNPKIKKRRYG